MSEVNNIKGDNLTKCNSARAGKCWLVKGIIKKLLLLPQLEQQKYC